MKALLLLFSVLFILGCSKEEPIKEKPKPIKVRLYSTPITYPVSFPLWSKFMNRSAVWISDKYITNSSNIEMITWDLYISKEDKYIISSSVDNKVTLLVDKDTLNQSINSFSKPHIDTFLLKKGLHEITAYVNNFRSPWGANPVGIGIEVSNVADSVVFSTRDRLFKDSVQTILP
jgi:hypothetical protein